MRLFFPNPFFEKKFPKCFQKLFLEYFWALDMAPNWAVPGLLSFRYSADLRRSCFVNCFSESLFLVSKRFFLQNVIQLSLLSYEILTKLLHRFDSSLLVQNFACQQKDGWNQLRYKRTWKRLQRNLLSVKRGAGLGVTTLVSFSAGHSSCCHF